MWAVDGLVPALTVVVDVTAAEGRRRRGDTHDRLESEEDAFHDAIRQHFLSMAAGPPRALPRRRRHRAARAAARRGPGPARGDGAGRPVSVWSDVIGQESAVATLAARRAHARRR